MVNTFVTHRPTKDDGYLETAKNIDNKRLGTQVKEAYQILNMLEDIPLICKYFGWESPSCVDKDEDPDVIASSFLKRVKVCKEIVNKYLKGKTRILVNSDNSLDCIENFKKEDYFIATEDNHESIQTIDKKKRIVRVFLSCIHKKECECEKYRDFFEDNIIYPDKRIITIGYGRHPILHMWIGYEDSLRRYINDMQTELRKRHKKDGSFHDSKIKVRDPGYDVIHPWWATTVKSYCWISHRSALYVKEISRGEAPWYSKNKDFNCKNTKIWRSKTSKLENKKNVRGLGYCWFGKLEKETICGILEGKTLPPEIVAFPQTDSIIRPAKNKK